jgi:hypothetical protein
MWPLIVCSYSKSIVNHVRKPKSILCGGVDMEAIVSAICAPAGHELRACFLSFSRFDVGPRAGDGTGVALRESGLVCR